MRVAFVLPLQGNGSVGPPVLPHLRSSTPVLRITTFVRVTSDVGCRCVWRQKFNWYTNRRVVVIPLSPKPADRVAGALVWSTRSSLLVQSSIKDKTSETIETGGTQSVRYATARWNYEGAEVESDRVNSEINRCARFHFRRV